MLPLSVVDLPTVPALGKWRSEEQEFKAILGYTAAIEVSVHYVKLSQNKQMKITTTKKFRYCTTALGR